MRIIAGKYGSIPLKTLKGDNTRPTLDKVKEAIFSSIGPYFEGGICLDLFSGSGAIGLECLSRGMDKAILVDNNHEAISIIKENTAKLKTEDAIIIQGNYLKGLNYCENNKLQLKLIYLDPPYAKASTYINKIMEYVDSCDLLSEEGTIIVESLKEDQFKEEYQSFKLVKEVIYGIMKVTYYTKRKGDIL